MKIRCLAVDDEPMALEKLKNYINRIPYFELVASCTCPYEAMQILADNRIDVVFIDINMPDVNGMDFVKSLPEPPMIVFTTAYAEYAADSYKVRAIDYLLKPFTFADFQKAAGYVHQAYQNNLRETSVSKNDDYLFLKVDYRYVKVLLNDIIYVEGMNEYLKIHTLKGDPILIHTTFKQLSGYLPENFLQIHRSYMVNMNHILEIERSMLLLEGGKRISVSDSNKEMFMAYLNRYVVKK